MSVQDINRPDVNGTPPKMQGIRDKAAEALEGICPVLRVTTDDNLCSAVYIGGSFDERDDWPAGIFQNSRYFRFSIYPAKRMRYYDPAFHNGRVTVELVECGINQSNSFRRYSGTTERVIAKIESWLKQPISE